MGAVRRPAAVADPAGPPGARRRRRPGVAAVVFAAVGAGLIRAQSQVVARDELDRQARRAREDRQHPGRAQAAGGVTFSSVSPASLEALVGPQTQLYYSGLPLTPGAERPTDEIPQVAARELDYGVLERDGRAAHRLRGDAGRDDDGGVGGAGHAGRRGGRRDPAGPPAGEPASAWPDVAPRVFLAAGDRPGGGPAPVAAADVADHPPADRHAGGDPPRRGRRPADRARAHGHAGAGRAGVATST